MSYADSATTATDPGFQNRVRAAMFASCARIGAGDFADRTQRDMYLSLLSRMIREPELYTTTFAWTLAAYSGITTNSTDTELDAAVTALWPAVSGYIAAGGAAQS